MCTRVALGIPAAQANAPAAAASPAPAWLPHLDPPLRNPRLREPQRACPGCVAQRPDMVDYVARYNQEVLNQQPTNWGNVILIVLLLGLLGVGLFFINQREGWISVSFTRRKP